MCISSFSAYLVFYFVLSFTGMQADIYSLGIILFELFCPFGTEMERVKNIKDLRQGRLPQDFYEQWPEEVRCVKAETHNPGRQPLVVNKACRNLTCN